MDIAATDLEQMMRSRTPSEPDPDEREPSYAASVRAYREKERQEHLHQRLLFHRRMLAAHAENFQQLIAQHRTAAERCEAALGIHHKVNDERKDTP